MISRLPFISPIALPVRSVSRPATYGYPPTINPRARCVSTPDFTGDPWYPYDDLAGGDLRPRCYSVYAQHFVKFIRADEAEGIPIYAVTVQNEPGVDRSEEKDPRWQYPSCHGPAYRRGTSFAMP